jgi:hypothetical protein
MVRMHIDAKRTLPWIVALLLVAPVLTSRQALAANEVLVCYKINSAFNPNDERLVLDFVKHSDLKQGQVAWSAHGKHTNCCGKDTMSTVTGTAVFNGKHEAHLGLISYRVRILADGLLGPQVFDCTTNEISGVPHSWTCQVWDALAKGQVTNAALKKVNDKECNIFED